MRYEGLMTPLALCEAHEKFSSPASWNMVKGGALAQNRYGLVLNLENKVRTVAIAINAVLRASIKAIDRQLKMRERELRSTGKITKIYQERVQLELARIMGSHGREAERPLR